MEQPCLLIHGFTGSVWEVEPLASYLRDHDCRPATFLLKGLGGTRRDMRGSTRLDWLRIAEEELEKLLRQYPRIHLIGFSTGALIASHLAIRYPERISTLTLLAAPVYLFNGRVLLRSLTQPHMLKNYARKLLSTPIQTAREFKSMLMESNDIYSRIEMPTLVVQGDHDHIVRTESAHHIYRHLRTPAKKLLIVNNCGHMVCHHAASRSDIFEHVLRFVTQVRAEQPDREGQSAPVPGLAGLQTLQP
ncbi:alpha/beta fold hydrolase [Paenibacillus sp. IB182496]|uniref:Alpha/beta fold hydrolase n=1 Tax=Paenibacillus sabuli TaxID=2772509 RepID=A0A927GTK0_9BACL|nr:alpha/beta fold hydrolase [Paenibacillus sabuli]MBD2847170.1 alpha/beta fold hydrolase [Paenibacillus sabuli]